MLRRIFILILLFAIALSGCAVKIPPDNTGLRVLAVESFLADIAQNVAGDLFVVDSLIPFGTDPHSFELTPQDLARIENSQLLLINGGGLEAWLDAILSQQDLKPEIINCSQGLEYRDAVLDEAGQDHAHEHDPHFWLDPLKVIQYVQNIRQAFSTIDPSHQSIYERNADQYTAMLIDLDYWIEEEVSQIPQKNRKLITNHENLGYFADRYGFEIVGTILMSTTSSSMPSASSITELEELISSTNIKAIFMNLGENTQLADQIATDLGIRVVTGLYTHSLSDAEGPAPDYISMMKYDVQLMINALRQDEKE